MRKVLFAVTMFVLPVLSGCKDQRQITTPPSPPRPTSRPLENPADQPGHVEVDTGAGGVKVDVDAPALRERVEERREEREAATPK